MVEWALYLDESGDAKPHTIPVLHGRSPVFTLGGVALPLELWRDYHQQYMFLKIDFFKNEIDASSKHAAQWEFKGNRAIAPRNRNDRRIKNFVYNLLTLIEKFQGRLFAVNVVKNPVNPASSSSIYTLALQLLAERFDIFLREYGVTGITIIDSRTAHMTPGRGVDYTVGISYITYVFGHETGRGLKRLIEAPLFADSSLTAGVQIADVIAALLYANTYLKKLAPGGADDKKGYLNYQHVHDFWHQINGLEFKSKGLYEGYRSYGFRTIEHRARS